MDRGRGEPAQAVPYPIQTAGSIGRRSATTRKQPRTSQGREAVPAAPYSGVVANGALWNTVICSKQSYHLFWVPQPSGYTPCGSGRGRRLHQSFAMDLIRLLTIG